MNGFLPFVRALIGVIAALGIAALVVNTLMTGRDVPNGLLGLLTFTVGAVFGFDLVRPGGPNRRRGDRDE